MAMTRTNIAAPLGADLAYRVVTMIEEAYLDLRAMPRTYSVRNALQSLTDWELNDLGIVRADIPGIARRVGRNRR